MNEQRIKDLISQGVEVKGQDYQNAIRQDYIEGLKQAVKISGITFPKTFKEKTNNNINEIIFHDKINRKAIETFRRLVSEFYEILKSPVYVFAGYPKEYLDEKLQTIKKVSFAIRTCKYEQVREITETLRNSLH